MSNEIPCYDWDLAPPCLLLLQLILISTPHPLDYSAEGTPPGGSRAGSNNVYPSEIYVIFPKESSKDDLPLDV